MPFILLDTPHRAPRPHRSVRDPISRHLRTCHNRRPTYVGARVAMTRLQHTCSLEHGPARVHQTNGNMALIDTYCSTNGSRTHRRAISMPHSLHWPKTRTKCLPVSSRVHVPLASACSCLPSFPPAYEGGNNPPSKLAPSWRRTRDRFSSLPQLFPLSTRRSSFIGTARTGAATPL